MGIIYFHFFLIKIKSNKIIQKLFFPKILFSKKEQRGMSTNKFIVFNAYTINFIKSVMTASSRQTKGMKQMKIVDRFEKMTL